MHALLIHGAGGGSWEWNVWNAVLHAGGVVAHAPDLQPVAAGVAATRWEDYLAQVTAAASALPAPRVLIGASLGGLLVLDVAARVGCAALVLINPLPPLPEASLLPAQARHPAIIAWSHTAGLASTTHAMPDADAATCLFASRRWRDESGAVLNHARAGIAVPLPACRTLMMASRLDQYIPVSVSVALAARLGADLLQLPDSHVGPLLGRFAAKRAALAVRWINANGEFRSD